MSDLELDCFESWKKNLPDFQFKRWDESSFDYSTFQFANDAYKFKKYAFVSDVCRLYVLYQEGGIYLDTDMLVLKDLSPLLDSSFFLGEEKYGVLNAAILGCEAGNEIIKDLLDGYHNVVFSPDNPISIPTYLKFNLDRNRVKVYTKDFFYPLPYKDRGKNFQSFINHNSFAVHLWNHSWKDHWDYLHIRNFKNSLIGFFNQVRLRGFISKDANFILAFFKFWIAAKLPSLYRQLKK